VKVREKVPFGEIAGFAGLMTGAEERIAGSGRILVRYSGTELLARVMVEGVDREAVDAIAGELADELRRTLGVPD
jgi:phosphoglucosamine mutase